MKTGITIILLLCCSVFGYAQNIIEKKNSFAVAGGMGVHLVAMPSLNEYIHLLATSAQQVNTFATAVGFFADVEIPVSEQWGIKLEHEYLFKTYSIVTTYDVTYTIGYAVQSPTIMAQYCLSGKGYFLKLNGGGGWHSGNVTISNPLSGNDSVYSTSGPGFKFEAVGQTEFDEHLFGYIAGTLDAQALGKVKSTRGGELSRSGTSVALNYFSAGVRFGLIYYW